ncbi:MAG: AmpG family muropeptide MFS transporter [Proteobacteria bacterium]|nr:AmpG family muropeptide MFS transporter [Pseudomonadota bacterium]MBU1688640.1 AmpG family muropeptide MFS transporter [Pseudomonadota bacterium]
MIGQNRFWRAVFGRRMVICFFNGFSAGMPLFFLYQLLPAWLRSEHVDLKTIGLFSLVGIPYTWKFVWAPFMDRYVPPFLGRRRGWMLITQLILLLTMSLFGLFDPRHQVPFIAALACFVAFASASQDIVLDAYRRELLPDEELGLGNAMYVNGYRAAVFIPGGLGLVMAGFLPWRAVFFGVACFMAIGIMKTVFIAEVAVDVNPPKSIREAVWLPFCEFFDRKGGVGQGLLLLAFLFLYKIGDSMATSLSTPFYLDLGFSMTVIGTMVKMITFWAMIVGSILGGIVIFTSGINRSLWYAGGVQMVSILGFALLSTLGPSLPLLGGVIAFEYLGVGFGTSALVAFMSRATSHNFTATQFALFSSLIALPRTFVNALTGFMIEGVGRDDGVYFTVLGGWQGMGYTNFFLFCTLCAIPGIILLKWVAPWKCHGAVIGP